MSEREGVRGLVELRQIAYEMRERQVARRFKSQTLIDWADRIESALAAEGVQAGEVEQRARESDRQRFSDPEFNAWLDTGISDAGHTVWDAVGDTQAAWAGWEARQFTGDAVLISECCGREECGGECGNEWRGMTMCRKPAEALSQQPEARGVVDEVIKAAISEINDLRDAMFATYAAAANGADKPQLIALIEKERDAYERSYSIPALTAALTGERNAR